jgi:hypothetical protein
VTGWVHLLNSRVRKVAVCNSKDKVEGWLAHFSCIFQCFAHALESVYSECLNGWITDNRLRGDRLASKGSK